MVLRAWLHQRRQVLRLPVVLCRLLLKLLAEFVAVDDQAIFAFFAEFAGDHLHAQANGNLIGVNVGELRRDQARGGDAGAPARDLHGL